MIYFVDEDFRKLRALMSELVIRGYDVINIRDADAAYLELSNVNKEDVQLVIIDVMLAANSNQALSRYSRKETDDYHKTGLLLLDDLADSNPRVFPRRAVYLSHASSDALLRKVSSSVRKHNVRFLRKKDYDTAYEFGEQVDEIIKDISQSR